MTDVIFEEISAETRTHGSRPSLTQVKTIVNFMEKHRDLAKKKHRFHTLPKYKKLWSELTDMVNLLEGTVKPTEGWIKFWSDRKRFLITKQRQIEEGKLKSSLTTLEQRILNLSDKRSYVPRKKKRTVKQEPYNDDDNLSSDGVYLKGQDYNGVNSSHLSSESEEKQLTMFEKMVEVMDQQAAAMTQIAQASLTNSEAFARLAEASHTQALAVDRLVGTFDTISSSAHDIRNAILGIDYTLKRVYPTTQRQNSALFS